MWHPYQSLMVQQISILLIKPYYQITQQQPTLTLQTSMATSGMSHQNSPANEMKGDNEVLSDSGSHPDSDCDNCQILSKEDVVDFLGLLKEAGPIGFTRQVGEMTVNDAIEWYALPPEHLEELHKKVSDKLAQLPWPRKAPAMS